GARIGRRGHGIEPPEIQEIARMRHRHVVGIAAVAVDAEGRGLRAHVLFAGETDLAFTAAEPGIDQRNVADLEIAGISLGIRPERNDLADGLMSHRPRQRYATIPERQRLSSVTEIVAAFPDVQ